MNDTSSTSPRPRRLARPLARTTRLVLIGGMAAGAGFAGVTGIASATGSSSTTSSTSRAPRTSSSTSPAPSSSSTAPGRPGPPGPGRGPGGGGHGPRGGPWGPLGGPGGPGGGGTITRIDGSTLTLRTMNGTEAVDTSSSTTYTKELQTISFSSLRVGEVVHVAGSPASTSSSSTSTSSTRPEPGTGTVDAARVTVVEPSFAGRVASANDGTYTLVGRDGQLLTVTTTGSTRYYDGTTRTSSSAISTGSHVMAMGPQDSLTHLSADVVVLAPAPPSPGRAPSAPSSSTSTSTSGQSSSSTTPAPAVGS